MEETDYVYNVCVSLSKVFFREQKWHHWGSTVIEETKTNVPNIKLCLKYRKDGLCSFNPIRGIRSTCYKLNGLSFISHFQKDLSDYLHFCAQRCNYLRIMYHKHVSPSIQNFSHTAMLCSEVICPNIRNSTTPFMSNQSTEKNLAGKLVSILKASSTRPVYKQGQQIHAQIIVNEHNNTVVLGTKVLGIYVLSTKIKDAEKLFHCLDLYHASPWNWMIRGFTIMGRFDFAVSFYFKMLAFGSSPDKYTFPYVIKACAGLNAPKLGKVIHKQVRSMGYETDMFIGSSLIKFYADNNSILEARHLFDKMPEKDGVLWNVLLSGYTKSGQWDTVIELFQKMKTSQILPNSVTYTCVLSVCSSEGINNLGFQVHGLVVKCGLEMDPSVANTLLAFYAKCRCLLEAHSLFDILPKNDAITWNAIIGGYIQNGFMYEALELFKKMIHSGIKPDSITFSSFLPLISESVNLNMGKEIHAYITRHCILLDIFLRSALIDVYSKCRKVEMASNLFNNCSEIDIVICSAMISGYVLNGMSYKALEVFKWLIRLRMKPNAVTLASILPACAGLANLELGKELHTYILRSGVEGRTYIGSAITDMYAKCGRLDLAYLAFGQLSEPDIVCWNTILTSCSQNGKPVEAIQLFRKMGLNGTIYDCVSISAALSACTDLPALHHGKEIHGYMIRGELISDIFSASALIDLYAKCGNLDWARRVFVLMREKNEVTWNSIISAYGNHGRLDESIKLFEEMIGEGFEPDHITFLSILSTCGHAGQVDKGKYYFNHMTENHGIRARKEHYSCMVDLFARSGRLKEAFEIITKMPFEPDAGIWGTLLGSCRVHGNVELAEIAAKHLFELDPQNSGYYVLLSNLQVDAGKMEGALETRSMMRDRRVQKVPGYSWIESNNFTHMFVSADTSHPQAPEIYHLLDNLLSELKIEGYVPQLHAPIFQRSIEYQVR